MADSVLAPGLTAVTVESAPEIPTHTYRLDLKEGRIAGYVDDVQAVEQAAAMAILAQRFTMPIFDTQYGSEVNTIIGADGGSPELVEEEINRTVRDALSRDNRIIQVVNVTTTLEDDEAHIVVEMETIYGNAVVEVVV